MSREVKNALICLAILLLGIPIGVTSLLGYVVFTFRVTGWMLRAIGAIP